MTARVVLNDGCTLTMDCIQGTRVAPTRGVLLSFEGSVHGDVLNCALIPLDRIRAVIASLELVAEQAKS